MKEKIEERIKILGNLYQLADKIDKICEMIKESLKNGGKIFLCGNGGSASDSSHISAEFMGKVKYKDAKPLPALNLSSDMAVITAIANDYGYEYIFSKQLEALAGEGDILIVFSTSGRSKNIVNAVEKAREMGLKIIYFTGKEKPLGEKMCDVVVNIPTRDKQIIQEIYMILWHIMVGTVEEKMEE